MIVIDLDGPSGFYQAFRYSAGEWQVRLSEEQQTRVKGQEICIVCGHLTHDLFFKLACLRDALHESEAGGLYLYLAYMSYSRADRRFVQGDCWGLEVFGSMLDALAFRKVWTLDIHNEEPAKKIIDCLWNIEPNALIGQAADDFLKDGGYILFPDRGAKVRYKFPDHDSYTQRYAEKVRDPETGKLSKFEIPALHEMERYLTQNGRLRVLMVDDICDAGGTFLGLLDLLPRKADIGLYVTHGIFSKGFTSLLGNKFDHIYTTNSIFDPYRPQFQPKVTSFSAFQAFLPTLQKYCGSDRTIILDTGFANRTK